ncbi:manganese transport protein [Streptoalloteichus tenebrarius]|uniref:Manganese transport protein n=1 Tax=Streptoalloteichus tenebrarius (strain ATCC 17920 / DSM 40477 / JCM 4838 / CBS 697.72 / NBRC 16177 / NCIMB 11028 / NRRL B-12390 / A12253. 1 / ISP 5477) TaxID=1933 RepID=A0ABT1HU59_STRSD|nr:Nramp family divalent metal transporter [Streptoalloteichus tenebrarius]MCP2259060.1 manganese transport protein [Streptoalloteichus tenebrarius]BFE99614.1 Nramp family divalent metal transporter [Streptoalloteichus tenebrarius]
MSSVSSVAVPPPAGAPPSPGPTTRLRRLRAGAASLGPAFVAAVAYVDPGNVATNASAGARYGYLLVWVVVVANAMAGLVQYLSAKLGLVTGRTLPELLGQRLGRVARLAYWAQAELVAAATDLAEVLGGAIALHVLFGLPPLGGALVVGAVSTALLLTQDRGGQRRFERVVIGLLAVVAVGFVAGLLVAPPSPSATVAGLLPRFADSGSVLLATGIVGATVMPHAIYLHSALSRDRFGHPSGPERLRLLAATRVDVSVAMTLAGLVNLAILLLGASALAGSSADSIEDVHAAVGGTLGEVVAVLFAVGLLASGLASTSVGCYAGSVVMAGLLHRRVPVLVRRVVTVVPALLLLAAGMDPDRALVVSQVALSFGLPFALVPLVLLTARRSVLGEHANRRATTAAAVVVTVCVITLNALLTYLTFG